MRTLARFRIDEAGAVMVEATISMVLLLVLTLGFVDFGYAWYQWNAAAKAVEIGARMASISTPVAPQITGAGVATIPGNPVPVGNYDYTCNGATSACTCVGSGCVAGTFTPANFNRVFRGDAVGVGTCPALAAGQRPGMCHFFSRLQPSNIIIKYTATGLGYQTRASGSVPTITVSLQNMSFQFFFLSGLLGFNNIAMPSMLSTVTGEDMKSTAP
ncbi:TadE/TadG family type IV pilus assembly protein [Mesorhizobium sp. WSM1293]|uniref:TadE/TadG family type IV pilus assembly protein n=1 Tax=Mesorhizobium sp. WSM1293 TaxID=1040984 RepID=UPI000481A463|nr:TadE/TadG family type IV pilus assembly protein [Mesorhizobium sp. WSM1293]